VSLEESAKAGRETIITTPPQGEQLESIRQKLQDLVSKDEKLLDKQISVWTNVSSTTIRQQLFKVRSIEQLTLREFLATAPFIKENAEPSSANSGAPANQSETKDSVPGSKPEPTTDSALGHSLILSSGTGAPKTEMTPALPQNMPHQKLSVEEQVALWTNKLAEVEKRQESLRILLSLADNLVSLEGKVTWAKKLSDSEFLKVKPLLEPEPQPEAGETERKQGQKAQNSEIDRARNHNSDEGRAFKKSFYILQGAQQTLAAARKKLLEASTEAGLDSVRTPKGETAPIITNQTILKALRREGKYAGKLRNKIRRAGGTVSTSHMEGASEEAVITSPTPKDKRRQSSQDTTSRQNGHERKLRALNEKIERKSAYLKEAREMLERAKKMTGPWADGEEAKSLESRGSLIDDQERALNRITELQALQEYPSTREIKNIAEINTILERFRMRTVDFFRELVARKKEVFEADLADFMKSNSERQAYWTKRVIDLQGELDTLRAKLPQTDATPGDLPMETNVDEQTAVVQDSELAALDKQVSDDSESAAS
jgi:hypothetical protein